VPFKWVATNLHASSSTPRFTQSRYYLISNKKLSTSAFFPLNPAGVPIFTSLGTKDGLLVEIPPKPSPTLTYWGYGTGYTTLGD
jgi:hypothetical protein